MYDTHEFTFIEHPLFTKQRAEVANDETYRTFQLELADRPEQWPVVKGTGGLRKARMRVAGRGKSGSARVLYLWFRKNSTFCPWLAVALAKAALHDLYQGRHRECPRRATQDHSQ